jgi:hypothetical protein
LESEEASEGHSLLDRHSEISKFECTVKNLNSTTINFKLFVIIQELLIVQRVQQQLTAQ